jgi:DUF4097 and DUF4098 domain-containing protein YvlB
MHLVQEESFDMKGIKNLGMNFESEEVILYPSTSSMIEIKEYMNYEPSDLELSVITAKGDAVEIKQGESRHAIFSWNTERKIEIYVPEAYEESFAFSLGSGSLDITMDKKFSDFNLELKSGKITTAQIAADLIDIDCSSGKADFDALVGEQNIVIQSGEVKIDGGSGDAVYHCSSGSFTATNELGIVEAELSSGKMELIIKEGSGNFSTSSGNMDVEIEKLAGDLDIELVSGSTDIELPEDAAFEFEAHASSGHVETSFDVTEGENGEQKAIIGDNPEYRIYADVESGTLDILNR